MRRVSGSVRRVTVEVRVALLIIASLAAAMPAAAQEMITTGPVEYDRARLTGFVWRGDVNGTIDAPALDGIPGFRRGVDVQEDLGLSKGSTGWLVEANVGLAPRHRFVVSFAGIAHDALSEIAVAEGDNLITQSDISIRDFHGAYEFLFSSRSWINAGAQVGLGYFDSTVAIAATPLSGPGTGGDAVDISQAFASPYPLIGASVLLKSEDLISIRTELSGFPFIEAGGQKGWLMNISIDFIVYPVPSIGLIAGYKRYQLSLNDDPAAFGANLIWDGYVIGAQYIFGR